MRLRCSAIRLVAIALCGAFPSLAFAQAQADNSTAAECDVAVWTGAEFVSQRFGLLPGGMFGEVGKKPETELNGAGGLAAIFTPQMTFEVISQSKLPAIIGKSVHYTLMDRDVHQSRSDRKAKVRNIESTKACYIEIFVASIWYWSDPVWGEKLEAYFKIRDFSGKSPKSYFGSHQIKAKDYALKPYGEGVGMAKAIFQADFEAVASEKLGTGPR